MKLFNYKRSTQKMEDPEKIVCDFKGQTPYWSCRPVEYKIKPDFIELKAELNSYLEKIFKGEIDEGNSNFLDNIIADYMKQALHDLEHQKVLHHDALKNYSCNTLAMKQAFETHQKYLETELEKLNPKIDDIEARLDNDTFERKGE